MTGGGGCQGGEIVVRGEGRGGEEGQGISWGGGRRGRCSVVSSEVRFLSMWAAVLQQRRSWPRLCQGAAIIQRVSQNVAWLPVGRTRVPFDVLPHLRNLTTFFFHACLLFFIYFVRVLGVCCGRLFLAWGGQRAKIHGHVAREAACGPSR